MSGSTKTYYRLVCDCCSATVDGDNATQARLNAIAESWVLVPKLRRDGTPARSTSDVCPSCRPHWQTKPATIAPELECSCGRSVTPTGAIGHLRMTLSGEHHFDRTQVTQALEAFEHPNVDHWLRELCG